MAYNEMFGLDDYLLCLPNLSWLPNNKIKQSNVTYIVEAFRYLVDTLSSFHLAIKQNGQADLSLGQDKKLLLQRFDNIIIEMMQTPWDFKQS
jgi:hypothetical protein